MALNNDLKVNFYKKYGICRTWKIINWPMIINGNWLNSTLIHHRASEKGSSRPKKGTYTLTLCMKLAWKEFLLNLPLLCMKLRVSHKWVLGDGPNWCAHPIIHCTDVISTNYPQNCTNWALVWTYSEITRLTL